MNTTYSRKLKAQGGFKNLKNAAIIIIMVLLPVSFAFSKDKYPVRYAINTDVMANGNGHGTYFGVGAELRSYRNAFGLMPMFQGRSSNINAVNFTYSRILTGIPPRKKEHATDADYIKFELRVFSSLSYFHGAKLSAPTIALEGSNSEEFIGTLRNMKMNTVQFNTGLGGNFKLNGFLMIRTYLGIGYYNHLNMQHPLYHEKGAPILSVGAGIGFLR